MITDSTKRRLRHAGPQPKGRRISIMPDDLALFSAINRHGPLPTNFLHAFLEAKNFNAFQYRLTKLFNGTEQSPPLLFRPPQQFQSLHARYQPLVYDLTSESESLLVESGAEITERSDPFLHRLMGACLSASLEIACRGLGIRYIPRAEVLAKRGSQLSIRINGRNHVPDDLFGLRYLDGSYRFFAVEIDRQTESIQRHKSVSASIDQKLRRYLDVMHDQLHVSHWAVPNLLVLFVTTNQTHKHNIISHLDRLTGTPFKERFLFKVLPEFGTNWRIPGVRPEFLTGVWLRTSAPFSIAVP